MKNYLLNDKTNSKIWNIEVEKLSFRFKTAEMVVYIYNSIEDYKNLKKDHLEKRLFTYSDKQNKVDTFDFKFTENLCDTKLYITNHLENYLLHNEDSNLINFKNSIEVI